MITIIAELLWIIFVSRQVVIREVGDLIERGIFIYTKKSLIIQSTNKSKREP